MRAMSAQMEEGGGKGLHGSIREGFPEEGDIPRGFSTHSQVTGTTWGSHSDSDSYRAKCAPPRSPRQAVQEAEGRALGVRD